MHDEKREKRKLVHPSQELSGQSLLSSKTHGWNGILVERRLQPPREVHVPPLNAPLILQILHDTPRQISRFGGTSYEGRNYKNALKVIPHGTPGFYAWETHDDAISVVLELDLLHRVAAEVCQLNLEKVEIIPHPFTFDPIIVRLHHLFAEELCHEGIGGQLYADSLATAYAVHLLRRYGAWQPAIRQYTNGLPKAKLRRVIDYIDAHLDQDIKLDTLAAEVGLSRYYFARLFNQTTGKAPHQYMRECRLERAKALLTETDLSGIEIAHRVGFRSQSHFITAFRQFTGTTPKVWCNR